MPDRDGPPLYRAAQRYSPRALTDGERWTAQALSELRRGGYRAAAWRRFLRSSLERADTTRRERPQLARQARTWGAGGAVAWVLACHASRDVNGVRLRPVAGLLWWLAVCQMLDWHLGMAEGGDGRPRARLSPADALSLARFWLVPVVPAVARSTIGLPAVIGLAGLTDWLDGALARRHGRTRLGRDLDTTADLAFLTTVAVCARAADRITPLGFSALVARHALGLAVSLGAVFGRARRPAIRARPWAAVPRVAGLAMCAAGRRHAGTAALVIGCLVPPRSTARHLSLA
jgi:phosphatidylglycerophosphate synthase